MKRIDLETFPRRSHFEFFKSYAYPYMGITANVDVTNLYAAAKKMGGSPFLGFLWAAATAANSVPELRQRIVEDGIVEYDHCDTAHTVALPDGTFVNCRTDCRRSFAEFQSYGRQCQEEAKGRHGFVQPGEDETSLIFVSSTPWITFTQVIQPTPIPADSNVRIVFGKFFEQNGRKMLPVNIQCNHALVDGLHVAEFFRKFQELADSDLEKVAPVILDESRDYGKYPTFAPLRAGISSFASKRRNADWKNNVLRSDEVPVGIGFDHVKDYSVFGSGYRRERIRSVTFLDTLREMPGDAWDVSETRNGSVMAWVKPDGMLCDLYIAAEGGIRAGESCKGMFAGYVNLKQITFGTVLHTEGVKNMSSMFQRCSSLINLDLSSFNTSGVQDMFRLFADCTSLTELNLSSFNTAQVKRMSSMFYGCSSLIVLDLSSFDTSGVASMSSMFDGCRSLSELNLSRFDTSKVDSMSFMFKDCISLANVDLSSFDTSGVTSMYAIFNNCPAGSKWNNLLH